MSSTRQRHLAWVLLIFFITGFFHISFFYHFLNRGNQDSASTSPQVQVLQVPKHDRHQRLQRVYQEPTVAMLTSTSTSKPPAVQDETMVCVEKLDSEVTIKYQECADEEQIFSDARFEQDDPLLLEWVRRKLLEVPNLAPYNLTPLAKQWGKDEFKTKQYLIIQQLLGNKRNGVFVEAGANDGEELSNTIRLETEFGWSGLLVEPDSAAYSRLRLKNRKAFSANVCLSPTVRMKKMKFTVNRQFSTLSKITDFSFKEVGWNWKEKHTETIDCVPFYTLVRSAGITHIDFLSLDIEGAELEVLETIPFDKMPILTMTVEYDKIADDPVKDARLQELMKANGFVHVMNYTAPMAADYVYAHKSILKSK